MPETKELLEKALETKHAAEWARQFNIDRSTIAHAKRIGRLSPTLAGSIAIELGESPERWIAIAALEAEQENELLSRLKRSVNSWRKL